MGKVAPRPPRPPPHDPTGGPTRPAPEYVEVHSGESRQRRVPCPRFLGIFPTHDWQDAGRGRTNGPHWIEYQECWKCKSRRAIGPGLAIETCWLAGGEFVSALEMLQAMGGNPFQRVEIPPQVQMLTPPEPPRPDPYSYPKPVFVDLHKPMPTLLDSAPVRPPQPQEAPDRARETGPRREPPPPPPKDSSGPSRSRRKAEVPPKMYGTSSASDKPGPLQTLYEDALSDVGYLVSTCFVLWWEVGGAALVPGVLVYLTVWVMPFGSTPIHELPPLDFRLWPFIGAVFAALLVCLLYCLPQMLKRQDAANQRRTQHAALVAERSANAPAQTHQ